MRYIFQSVVQNIESNIPLSFLKAIYYYRVHFIVSLVLNTIALWIILKGFRQQRGSNEYDDAHRTHRVARWNIFYYRAARKMIAVSNLCFHCVCIWPRKNLHTGARSRCGSRATKVRAVNYRCWRGTRNEHALVRYRMLITGPDADVPPFENIARDSCHASKKHRSIMKPREMNRVKKDSAYRIRTTNLETGSDSRQRPDCPSAVSSKVRLSRTLSYNGITWRPTTLGDPADKGRCTKMEEKMAVGQIAGFFTCCSS